MRIAPAVAGLLLLAPAAYAAPPRVGVIAIGSDPAAAGELQRDVETRLGAAHVVVKGANELAPAIGKTIPATAQGPDAATIKDAAELLQKATDAYYEDRAAFALDRLGALGNLQDVIGTFPVADRVRLLLWRTAIFLALKDEAQAETEALAALTLNPELKVDLNEFRPSVKDAVDKVRARGLRQATVVVNGLPSGAVLKIDERTVSARFLAPLGKHRVVATAAGRREVVRNLDVVADMSVPMTLPLALDPALDAALSGMVWRGQPSPSDVQVLSNLSQRLGIEWVVIAATRTEPQSESRAEIIALASGGSNFASPIVPNSATSNATLASWIAERLQAELAPGVVSAPSPTPTAVAVATPRPVRTPPPVAVRPPIVNRGPRTPMAFGARGGIVWLDRTRTVKGGGSYTTGFGGAGPRVVADLTRSALFGELELAFVNYGISTLDVHLPTGTKRSVNGGSSVVVRAGGGWRHAFSRDDFEGSPSVRLGLGIGYESHSAQDVKDDSNARLFLLTSYTREELQLRADGRVPFDVSFQPAATVGLGVAPSIGYSESPSGATGSSPAGGLGLSWHLGAEVNPSSRLAVSAEYLGAMRDAKFKGAAQAPTDPQIQSATVSESFQGFSLTARYRF